MILKFNNHKIQILFLLFSLVMISACGGGSASEYPKKPPATGSATKTVNKFLNALQNEDFDKAFKYIYTPYSDKEGYVNNLRNLVQDNKTSILNYRILGTQIFGEKAIVVAELTVKMKSLKSGQMITKKLRNQYELTVLGKDWKITTDRCIENCFEEKPEVEVEE